MITWNVYERTFVCGNGHATIRTKQVAICATRDQALDEVRRLTSNVSVADYGGDEWIPTYFVDEGAVAIGLVLLP